MQIGPSYPTEISKLLYDHLQKLSWDVEVNGLIFYGLLDVQEYCNDPTIGRYDNYHLRPNGIPSGNQRWYGLVYK